MPGSWNDCPCQAWVPHGRATMEIHLQDHPEGSEGGIASKPPCQHVSKMPRSLPCSLAHPWSRGANEWHGTSWTAACAPCSAARRASGLFGAERPGGEGQPAADPPPPAAEGRIPDPTGDSEALASCPDTDDVRARTRGRGRGARGRGRGRHRAQPMDDVAASTPGAQRQPRPPGHAAAWAALDQVDLGQELRVRCVTLRDVPRFCRGRFRQALTTALAELDWASAAPGDEAGQRGAWTLFALCSRMLLHRLGHKGKAGKQVPTDRFNRFEEGDWVQLIAEARSPGVGGARSPGHDSERRRLGAACASVRMGEASRARQQLVGSALAPGTAATLAELRDPARRPPALEVPLSDETREFMPPEPVHLDRKLLSDNLRSAPRGSSGCLSGTRYEHLKVILDDEAILAQAILAQAILAQAILAQAILAQGHKSSDFDRCARGCEPLLGQWHAARDAEQPAPKP